MSRRSTSNVNRRVGPRAVGKRCAGRPSLRGVAIGGRGVPPPRPWRGCPPGTWRSPGRTAASSARAARDAGPRTRMSKRGRAGSGSIVLRIARRSELPSCATIVKRVARVVVRLVDEGDLVPDPRSTRSRAATAASRAAGCVIFGLTSPLTVRWVGLPQNRARDRSARRPSPPTCATWMSFSASERVLSAASGRFGSRLLRESPISSSPARPRKTWSSCTRAGARGTRRSPGRGRAGS